MSFDPVEIISKIKNDQMLEESEIKELIIQSMNLFIEDSNILLLNSPITICGDIHGQLEDLFKLFEVSGGDDRRKYLFMGDFVDRGYYSIDTICYLLALRLAYGNVYLLRGNHESRNVNSTYGFYSECQKRFQNTEIYKEFNSLFDMFPLAAVIDGKVFSVHGGISPKLPSIETLNTIDRYKEPPVSGIVADLLWSDPAECDMQSFEASSRGSGVLFGETQCKEFLRLNDLEFMTRSHQLVMEGIQWMFNDKLVNIWSAPNYAYTSGNIATTMNYTGLPPRENEVHTFSENEVRRPIPQQTDVSLYFA